MLGRKHRDHRRDAYEVHDAPARVDVENDKGPGLARGPALLIGTLLCAAGLILFLEAGSTPTDAFPDGDAAGTEFLGFATNGWTAWFTTAAGVLLLFGAAQHLLARVMSLLVGAALAACVVISLIDGDDVLGLAVANEWTQLGWAVPAVLLLINSLMPRARRRRDVEHVDRDRDRVVPVSARERTVRDDERVVAGDDRTAVAHRHDHDDDRVIDRDRDDDRLLADDDDARTERTVADDDRTTTDPAAGSGRFDRPEAPDERHEEGRRLHLPFSRRH